MNESMNVHRSFPRASQFMVCQLGCSRVDNVALCCGFQQASNQVLNMTCNLYMCMFIMYTYFIIHVHGNIPERGFIA